MTATMPASPHDPGPTTAPTPATPDERRTFHGGIHSPRNPHTRESLQEKLEDCSMLEHASLPGLAPEPDDDPDPSAIRARLDEVWQEGSAESRALARRHRLLAPLWIDPEADPGMDARDEVEFLLAHALRTTVTVAGRMLYEAHHAVSNFPRTLDLLASADMPARWFSQMMRRSHDLDETGLERLDEIVASWPMTVSEERFRRELGLLIRWILDETTTPLPEPERCVEVLPASDKEGTACLQVTGPIPDIVALGRRLDQSARAVQDAQRRALRENAEEIPFDDGTVKDRGRPLSLTTLRYDILTHSPLTTDPVRVPAERFRINVTVPVMTLLGASNAPGEMEGGIPIPAAMARSLAGSESTWFRMLTDGPSGGFPALPADRYSPTPAMLEFLRMKNTTCAVPGCTRLSSWASEADHIIEFDHDDPHQGGKTEVENLHLLCWRHHQIKTLRIIDPVRIDPAPPTISPPSSRPPAGVAPTGSPPSEDIEPIHLPSSPRAPESPGPSTARGRTRWDVPGARTSIVAEDERDLFTPMIVEDLRRTWAYFEQHVKWLRKRNHAAEEAARKAAQKQAEAAKKAAAEAVWAEATRTAKAEGAPPPPMPAILAPPPLPPRDDPDAWGPDGPPPF